MLQESTALRDPLLSAEMYRVNADHVVSPDTAAVIMGISKKTLYRMHIDGKGPRRLTLSFHRRGYRISAIQAWLAERAAA